MSVEAEVMKRMTEATQSMNEATEGIKKLTNKGQYLVGGMSGGVGTLIGIGAAVYVIFWWLIATVDVTGDDYQKANGSLITMQVKNGKVDPGSIRIFEPNNVMSGEGQTILSGDGITPEPVPDRPYTIGANIQFHGSPWTCVIWNGSRWVTVVYNHPC